MKKLLLLFMVAWQAVSAQVTYITPPSWFKPTAAGSWFETCPVNYTMPDGHPFAVLDGRKKGVTREQALAKGITHVEWGSVGEAQVQAWLAANQQDKLLTLSSFFNDVWTRGSIVAGSGLSPSEFLNTKSLSEVRAAYNQGGQHTYMGFSIDDLEAIYAMNKEGAKNYRQVLLEAKAQTFAGSYFGGWNTHWYGGAGRPAADRALAYNATKEQIRANPTTYGFSGLWADDLYPGSGQAPRRLIDAYNMTVTSEYMMGVTDDNTLRTIEACEVTRKAFPELTTIGFQWNYMQPANTGATGLPMSVRGFRYSNYRQYIPSCDCYQDRGIGVWAMNPGTHPYPPEAAFNLSIWSFMYGGWYSWFFGGGSDDYKDVDYAGDFGGSDYVNLSSYYLAGIPQNRTIYAASTPVEMLEWSEDNGSTWHTGNDLTPGYTQANNWPLFRAKKSSDGSQALFLGFWEKGYMGATKNVLVRFPGTSKTYSFRAKRWTQLARVQL